MPTKVVILGAGGFARETLDVLDACNRERPGSWEAVGFVSEVESDWGRELIGRPVLGGLDWFDGREGEVKAVCGIGSPAVRRRVTEDCRERGVEFVTAIHPRATASEFVRFGTGCVVTAGVVITNEITVGDHVHLNLNMTIGHDAEIGDYCTIAPGVNVSGNVRLGRGCDVGTGASIIEKLDIGEWSIIGAGAVVTSDLPANVTAVGVPAKVIRTREEGWWRPV